MNWFDLGLTVKSGQRKENCPECPKQGKRQEDSLSVDYDNGLYNCHKCGFSGKISQQIDRPIYKHIKSNETQNKPLSDLSTKVLEWFKTRGIDEITLKHNFVKVSTRFMPQVKAEVETIAFQYIKNNLRVNTKYRDGRKNMSQDKGAEKCFYRFDRLKGAKEIYITEGEIDALTLCQSGFDVGVTSVPDGAPNPTANELENKFSYLNKEAQEIFEQAEKVYLVVDNDTNGKFLEKELARRIGKEKCYTVDYPKGCKDINDVLVKFGETEVISIITTARPYPISGIHKFSDYSEEILDYYENNIESGISTGWRIMDDYFRLFKGQLNILTGIPNSGKSEWLDALMINTINKNSWKWAVYSPENMPAQMHFQKLAEKSCNKSMFAENDRIDKRTLFAQIEKLSNHIDLIIPEDEELTLENILSKVKSSVFRTGINGFIIDPWNEIEHNIKPNQSETDYISLALAKIRRFARQYDLSAWIVAHPAKMYKDKNGEYPVPSLYDINGSANWRNKADNGFVVWRDFQGEQLTKVFIQKIRFKNTGKLGEVDFKWDWKTGNYTECTFTNQTTNEVLHDYGKENF